MKKLFVILFTAATVVSIPSCMKKYVNHTATEADAREAVAETLTQLSRDVEESSAFLDSETTGQWGPLDCGVPVDTTTSTSVNGLNKAKDFNYVLSCDNNNPASIALTGTYEVNYNTSYSTSRQTGNHNLAITGLDAADMNYTYSGSLHRTTYSSNTDSDHSLIVEINGTLNDLKVAKSNHQLVSGTSNVTLDCTGSDSQVQSFTGTVTIIGDHSATLTMNGNTYSINF